jgi:hypothetical protein
MKEGNPPNFLLLVPNQVMWSFLSRLTLLLKLKRRGEIIRRRGVKREKKRYYLVSMLILS